MQFQRTARRDKKAFLSDQCKEIEENSRMEMTRDLFKRMIDTKGTFHAKMGSIKDRNGMDLTQAEDIERWQGHMEELYRKDLHDTDNHDGVITHLEPEKRTEKPCVCQRSKMNERCHALRIWAHLTPQDSEGLADGSPPFSGGRGVDTLAESPCPGHLQIP